MGSPVIDIGKADLTPSTTLRKRVSTFLRFGAGGNARHRGGYPTWQLADSEQLVIAWRVVEPPATPRAVEIELIADHRRLFGEPPFANGTD